jgi:hypothetical protein
MEPDDALVLLVIHALDKSCRDGSIDQFDDAVVAQQQVICDVSDRRRGTVASDGEQELVLRTGEPDGSRLLLAPVLEPTQAVPERQQTAEVPLPQSRASDSHIVSR